MTNRAGHHVNLPTHTKKGKAMIDFAYGFGITLALLIVFAIGWPGVALLFLLICFMDWSGDGDGRQWPMNND